ncbi:MAG: HesA/MoeB/ThiF family protein [Saprospiraceae bacterium]|nr:HesA/MoeB/ThiF family protein [Saprospiraceae bacterium]
MERFARQIILPQLGWEGQSKLRTASVLCIGAGGLSCPALQYLAAAGVGRIGIVDGDVIVESNLNRQILFGIDNLGESKAEVAGKKIRRMYPDVEVQIFPFYLNTENALSLICDYDLILDGSDNFGTRYLINDACYLLGKPWVYGAVYRMQGQLACFNVQTKEGRSCLLRDFISDIATAGEVSNCQEAGVIGVTPGFIGVLMASEAIKWILDLDGLLINQIMVYDLQFHNLGIIQLSEDSMGRRHLPSNATEFQMQKYVLPSVQIHTISWKEALEYSEIEKKSVLWLDVREHNEEAFYPDFSFINLPFSIFSLDQLKLEESEVIFVFCQSGIRSGKAARWIREVWPMKKVFSLTGGINQYPYHESNQFYGLRD